LDHGNLKVGHRGFDDFLEVLGQPSVSSHPRKSTLNHPAMLAAYPKAKVIVAHFTHIRHPEKQRRFTPDYVRHLLSTYPNLYYDLANGHSNRKCK